MSVLDTQEQSREFTPRRFVCAILALAAANNFLLMLVASSGIGGVVIATLFVGVLGSQIALHAIWITFLPGRLWGRVILAAAMGYLCYLAWLAGVACLALQQGQPEFEEAWTVIIASLLCCPLISLAAQTPFWVMRICFSWRIMHHGDLTEESQLAIRDIMSATGAIAFVLAAARYAKPSMITFEEFLLPVAIVALLTLAASALISLPMLFGILKSNDGTQGCLLTVTVFAGIGFVLSLVLATATYMPGQVVAMYFAFFAGLVGSQAIVLHAARKLGYVVVTPRRRPPIDGALESAGGPDSA